MITVRLTEEMWEEACRGNRLLFDSDLPEVSKLLKAGERVTISYHGYWVLDKDNCSLFRGGTYGCEFTEWLKANYPEELL